MLENGLPKCCIFDSKCGALKSKNKLAENWIFEKVLYRLYVKISRKRGYPTFLDSPIIFCLAYEFLLIASICFLITIIGILLIQIGLISRCSLFWKKQRSNDTQCKYADNDDQRMCCCKTYFGQPVMQQHL